MNIIITGANGYLGKQVVCKLLENPSHHVIGISRHWPAGSLTHPRFKKVTCDLTRFSRGPLPAKKVDMIIHLAAIVRADTRHPGAQRRLLESNNSMLMNILDWAASRGVGKFVLASSMTVFANLPKAGMLNEKTPKEPVSVYGLSKFCAEHILRLYCEGTNIKGLILRFPGLFGGVRKDGLIYNLAKRLKNNQPAVLDLKGLGNWEFLHVADAARSIGTILKSYPFKDHYGVINVGYNGVMHLNELVKFLCKHYGSSSEITIRNTQDYSPCSLDVSGLKEWGRPLKLDRKKGLLRLAQEVDV